MKKIFALVLVIVMSMSMTSCGSKSEEQLKKDITNCVEIYAMTYWGLMYDTSNTYQPTASVNDIEAIDDDTYVVGGRAQVVHKLGPTFSADFVATVSVDEKGELDIETFDLDEPRQK